MSMVAGGGRKRLRKLGATAGGGGTAAEQVDQLARRHLPSPLHQSVPG